MMPVQELKASIFLQRQIFGSRQDNMTAFRKNKGNQSVLEERIEHPKGDEI